VLERISSFIFLKKKEELKLGQASLDTIIFKRESVNESIKE
jgi:hypothetical protein